MRLPCCESRFGFNNAYESNLRLEQKCQLQGRLQNLFRYGRPIKRNQNMVKVRSGVERRY